MKTVDVFVIEEHSSGNSLKCSMKEDGKDPFFLGKKLIIQPRKYRKGQINTFDITDFGWKSHRQLCGDETFEAEKLRRQNWEKNKS